MNEVELILVKKILGEEILNHKILERGSYAAGYGGIKKYEEHDVSG